jgi:hypothetical protein
MRTYSTTINIPMTNKPAWISLKLETLKPGQYSLSFGQTGKSRKYFAWTGEDNLDIQLKLASILVTQSPTAFEDIEHAGLTTESIANNMQYYTA